MPKFFLILRWAFALAVLWFALQMFELQELRSAALSMRREYLVLSILLLIPSTFLRSLRFKILFESNGQKLSLFDSFRLWATGMAINLVVPATAGDLFKTYLGFRWSGVKERMVATALTDKVLALGAIGFLGLFFVGTDLSIQIRVPLLLACLISLLPLVGLLIFTSNRFRASSQLFGRKLKRIKRFDFEKTLLESMTFRPKLFIGFVLSILGWWVTYLQLYLSFRAFDLAVSLPEVFSAAPILTLVRLLPLTISGLGTDEATMLYLFGKSFPLEGAIFMGAIAYRLIVLVLPGLVGVLVILRNQKNRNVYEVGHV